MTTTAAPPVLLTLRPYQEDALARVAAAEQRGVRSQLGVAATGLGKTVMFAALAQRRGGRTLVLAHRDELVQQAAAKVAEVWPGANIGVVKAERNDVHADVVVASVQTLARPARLAQLMAPWVDPGLLSHADPFGLVVVDEAHHAAADTYRTILDALHAGQPCETCEGSGVAFEDHGMGRVETLGCPDCAGGTQGPPLLLGVTATPDRGDGKGLDDLFTEITFTYDMLWGIRSGYLSDLRGKRVQLAGLDLSRVRMNRGDYAAGDAGRALTDADAPEAIVAAWLEHAADRRTLVFTPTVALAEDVADAFRAVGVAAGMVSGSTPLDERRDTLAAYHRGDLQVLANCAVLTEGYDEPRTDCVVIARPTRSRALYTQMIGRGTRRHPDKADCLVLDVVGATEDHSLVTVPSLFGLAKEYADRMAGPGGGGVAELIGEQEAEQVRLGLLRAEDVELFDQVRAEGIAWVQVHRPGEPRRYERPLGRQGPDGQPLPVVVLAEREPEHWVAGLWWPADRKAGTDERKRVLIHDVPQELAQGVAEDYVRLHGDRHLVRTDAAWRARPPTMRQLDAAKKWRLPGVEQYATAGALSEALDAHIQRRRRR